MTFVSQILHAAPMVAPSSGFAERVQKKLEYRQERRRRAVIWLFLGLGALVLLFLALPTLISALWFAGRMFLPYQIFAYGQGIINWCTVALRALSDAVWVILRFAATHPTVQTSLTAGLLTGAASVIWMRFAFRHKVPQRRMNR
jgi:multisubunit Na+/H+ antiporter MnhB subunit